jgi:hypothetical protein
VTVGLLSFCAQPNSNRVTINVPGGSNFLNIAKGFNLVTPPSNADSNGYPINTPAVALQNNGSLIPNYYGKYVWKGDGAFSMQFIGLPAIIYSGAQFISGSGNVGGVGSVGSNATVPVRLRGSFSSAAA